MSMKFNATFYLAQNSDVFKASIGVVGGAVAFAEAHYQNFGFKEFRNPNKDFNTKFYLTENVDVANNGMNPLTHFLTFGAKEGRLPNTTFTTKATFDTVAYAAANADLKKAGITSEADLYAHFATFGYDEVRTGMQTKDGTAITDGIAGGKAGAAFTLKTGADTIVGDAANNAIDGTGFLAGAGLFVNTLNNGDKIDGKGGTDTLTYEATQAVITPVSIKGIEVLNITNIRPGVAATTLSLVNGDAKLETINSTNALGFTAVNNIGSALKALNISNTAAATTVTIVSTALTGTADAIALSVAGVTGGGVVTIGTTVAGSGYETVNLDAKGTVNSFITLNDGLGNSLTTVNITGASTLALVLQDATVTTLNAKDATGILTLTVAAGSGAQTITGGTGNDVINMANTYTSADTINGGLGSDRMTLRNAEAIAATTAQTKVTNVETIGLFDGAQGTISIANFNATGLRLGLATANTTTLNYAAGANNSLDLQNFVGGGFAHNINIAGTTDGDVLAMTVGSALNGNTFGASVMTFNEVETINLTTQGAASTFAGAFTMNNTANSQKLNILGNQNITFTGIITSDTVNASGMTGTGALSMAGGAGIAGTVITGSKNADTITGSTLGDIIKGGAGNDTIQNVVTGVGATSGDAIEGEGGNDSIALLGSGAATALAALMGNSALIKDFNVTGGDILQLSAGIANYNAAGNFHNGVAAGAAGTTVIQSVAQNVVGAAAIAGLDLIKFTQTGTSTGATTLQGAFNTAIGTGSVTGMAVAADDIFFSIYDTTNSRMVVGIVDAGNNNNQTIETGDAVSIVGSLSMTAADYTAFSNADLQIIA